MLRTARNEMGRIRSTVCLVAALGISAPSLCQEPPAVGPAPTRRVRVNPPGLTGLVQEVPIVSVEFAGGTIEEYIHMLSDAAPDLNIVMRPEAKAFTMPPVSLKGVGYATAIEIIPALAAVENGQVTVSSVATSGAPVFVVGHQPSGADMYPGPGLMPGQPQRPLPRRAGGGMTQPGGAINFSPHEAKAVRVFSLRAMTGGPEPMKPETILTAIDTALGMHDESGGQATAIKLHPESGLLIVHGGPGQIETVSQVLSIIEGDRSRQSDSAWASLREEKKKLEHEVTELRAQIEVLQRQLKVREAKDRIPSRTEEGR